MNVTTEFTITVTHDKSVNRAALAMAVFDFLCSDPDDLFPQIETVDGFEYKAITDVEPDGTIGPCPNCASYTVRYQNADDTRVACTECQWEGSDEVILGEPR